LVFADGLLANFKSKSDQTMNRTSRLFLLLSMFISISCFSQYNLKEINIGSQQPKLLKMPYTNSNGEQGITTFEYDKNGKLIKSNWKLLNNSRSSNNYYTYDERDHIIKKYREFSDGQTSSEDFVYDEKNRLISEDFRRSDGFTYSLKYQYNEQDQAIIVKVSNYHGWLTGEIHYSYDKKGRIEKGLIFRNGDEIGFVNFKYNSQNMLIEEYWEFSGSYNQSFRFEYAEKASTAYTSSNVFITNTGHYKIVSEDYTFNNENGGPSIYYYGSDGKLEKKIFKVNDQVKSSTTYFYDKDGLLTHSIRKLNNGQENTFRYTYNENRQLTDRINYLNDSVIGEEHYTYINGQLAEGIYKNFDYWLNGSLSFQYDAGGNLSKGFFKGSDGYDADIFFTHDNNANITKIHWVFTFGKTQTYNFGYESLFSN